jgi:hypothetical protein
MTTIKHYLDATAALRACRPAALFTPYLLLFLELSGETPSRKLAQPPDTCSRVIKALNDSENPSLLACDGRINMRRE